MAVKTITVTENAYDALKSLKEPNESFSETLLRVAKRKPLSQFYGVLSKESADRLEKAIMERRRERNKAHQARLKRIAESFEGR